MTREKNEGTLRFWRAEVHMCNKSIQDRSRQGSDAQYTDG